MDDQPPSTADEFEEARRAFLARVEALLPATGIAWTSIDYRSLNPSGSVGLSLTAPGVSGTAQVVAIALSSTSTSDDTQPSEERKPYYQLLIKNTHDFFIEYCVSPDPKVIATALQVWASLGQEMQHKKLPAFNAEYFEPLRHVAIIRARIEATTQRALSEGIERSSETLGKMLGVVRADDLSVLALGLTPTAQNALAEDLRALAPDLLLAHFPREADGRLLMGAIILLASYASSLPQSRDQQMWLVACAPKRRRDPQVVSLALASLIGVNHAHRWDQARWFWDCRCEAAPEEERWGVANLDLARLGLEKRAENLAFFTERCAQPAPSLVDRVSLCLLLQDEGRFEEAFALFNVKLTADVVRLLYQQPFSFHTASQTINQSSTLMEALALAAPWRFASLPAGMHHRLCLLPHQTQQRKACLMLITPPKHQPSEGPLLTIEYTASNKLLPHPAWRRPLDLELMRLRLLASEEKSFLSMSEAASSLSG